MPTAAPPIKFIKAAAIGFGPDVHILKPQTVHDIEGLNERIDYGDLDELRDSIREHGIKVPLVVRLLPDGTIGLVQGYRRMRCVRELIAEKKWKHEGVPAIEEPKKTTNRERLLGQLIFNSGKPYTILEQGRIFKRLVDEEGLKGKALEDATHKSRVHIANALKLAESPAEVIAQIAAGKISESLVIDFIHESNGSVDDLIRKVSETIGAAIEEGKPRASRKHAEKAGVTRKKSSRVSRTPAGTGAAHGGEANGAGTDEQSSSPPADSSATPELHKTDWKSVKGTPDPVLERFNQLISEVQKHECNPICWDVLHEIKAFLDGKRTIEETKAFMRD